jgi:hypothetical protein
MSGVQPRTFHVSKDETYDGNNNLIRSICHVSIFSDFGLEWKVNAKRFKIVAKNLPKSSQNTILVPKTTASFTNVILHVVEIKQEIYPNYVNPKSLFINLCNFSNEDGMPSISLCPSTFYL